MREDKTVEILKQAILLETRGRAFYQTAAEQSRSAAVREFFETMAGEETEHIRILSDRYRTYRQSRTFSTEPAGGGRWTEVASRVLSPDLKEKIQAAGFEAAAVSAAMAMEERAIRLYAGRAESAEDPEERALYRWLADWETTHLELLADLDRSVTEAVWNDNSFWPM